MGRRDVDSMLTACRKAGATTRRTGSGHWQVRLPGGRIVVLPSSPSDWRSMRNARALLRRAGVDL